MVDTVRAFQFRHSKSYHAIDPQDPKRYSDSAKPSRPQRKFKKGKELDREPKAAGGIMRATRKLLQQARRKRMGKPGGPGKIGRGGQGDKKQRPKPSPRKPRPKTYPPKRIMTPLAKGGRSFPDLSGDGKVTKKDILMGRGVIKK